MRVRTIITVAATLLTGALTWGQVPKVELFAASDTENGKPVVRLAWRVTEGWLSEGAKVYEIEQGPIRPQTSPSIPGVPGVRSPAPARISKTLPSAGAGSSKKRLVADVAPVKDEDIDATLDQGQRGRKLASVARKPLNSPRALNFSLRRSPSAAGDFQNLKKATEEIRDLSRAAPTRDNERKLAESKNKLRMLRGGVPGPAPATPGQAGQPVAPARDVDDDVLDARRRLHLLALSRPDAADKIGMAGKDNRVKVGEKVTYAIFAVSGGQEQETPLDTVTITVGADEPPPAPTGVTALQDEDRVMLRWDRVPESEEMKLLSVTYRVERSGGATRRGDSDSGAPGRISRDIVAPKWIPLNNRPIMIFDGEEAESRAFASDTLTLAGETSYRVSMVDGFGRQSAWSIVKLDVVDWRKPGEPRLPQAKLRVEAAPLVSAPGAARPAGRGVDASKLALETPGTYSLRTWSESVLNMPAPRATVVVSWSRPEGVPSDLSVRYRIYRLNMDDPAMASAQDPLAAAQLMTPQPIEGTPLVLDAAGFVQSASLSALRTRPYLTPGLSQLATNSEVDRERRSWVDSSCDIDRFYKYFIVAEYQQNGFVSLPVDTGVVAVPDPRPPQAVVALKVDGFTFAPERAVSRIAIADRLQPRVMAMGGVLDLKGFDYAKLGLNKWSYPGGSSLRTLVPRAGAEVRTGVPPRAAPSGVKAPSIAAPSGSGGDSPRTPSLKVAEPPRFSLPRAAPGDLMGERLVRAMKRTELNLAPRNDGGTVDLSWQASQTLPGLKYRVRRRAADGGPSPWADVALLSTTTRKDPVPRSRNRRYEYQVIPISRWGVEGPAATISYDAPATVSPSTPEVLSVGPHPTEDGVVQIRFVAAAEEEGVTEYRIWRTGSIQPVGTVAHMAGRSELEWSGPLAVGDSASLSVSARTSGGRESARSREVVGQAVKTKASPPTDVSVRQTMQGNAVEWASAIDAVAYTVTRRPAAGGAMVVIVGRLPAIAGRNVYLDTTAIDGKSYVYEVRAIDSAGNSSESVVVTR